MDRRGQELLDTQMKRFQPPSRRDGLMILAIIGVFLAGMTAGGFLFAAYRGQPTVQTASSDDGKTALAFFLFQRHSERRALIGFVAAADNQSPCFWALFRQVFLISAQWTSEQYCSQGCASYCA